MYSETDSSVLWFNHLLWKRFTKNNHYLSRFGFSKTILSQFLLNLQLNNKTQHMRCIYNILLYNKLEQMLTHKLCNHVKDILCCHICLCCFHQLSPMFLCVVIKDDICLLYKIKYRYGCIYWKISGAISVMCKECLSCLCRFSRSTHHFCNSLSTHTDYHITFLHYQFIL